MKKQYFRTLKGALLIVIGLVFATMLHGQDTIKRQPVSSGNPFEDIKVTGQWFLNYSIEEDDGEYRNLFTLKRGYITFLKEFNKTLSVRFTQDITLDQEGSDAGNIEMRLKYCYLRVNTGNVGFATDTWLEAGLVHRPWLSFVESINHYRVEGTMYLERYRVISSADFGLTYVGLLGGKVDSDYLSKVRTGYPGKYGSFAVGVYNGAGYHAIEQNNNKTIEGRMTLRPLPDLLPGLQTTYNFVRGKGNTVLEPDFNINTLFLSYQDRLLNLYGQYYWGKGNSSGSYADTTGIASDNYGYTFFGEIKIPTTNFAVFSRYDEFFTKLEVEDHYQRFIGGFAWYFYRKSKLIVDVDRLIINGNEAENMYEIAVEIRF